ncbi:TlpA family protein disulfide reductase [Sulfurimonas sp.]
MFKLSILSTLLATGLILGACSSSENSGDANSLLSSNEFVLTTLQKSQVVLQKTPEGFALKSPKAKLLILDIFATWCPPCQAEAPHLASLQEKYGDDILIVGATIEDGIQNEKLEDFKEAHSANYTLVNSNENGRLIDAIAKQLKLGSNFGIPLLVIYKDGHLVQYYQGAVEEEFIDSDIKRALGI